jgi:hypothetical protein
MKGRLILLSAILLGISSCGINEIETGRRPAGDGNWRNPSFSIDTSANARKVCYVTGLDYPEGYDWRSDSENGTVKCSLVVFADGVPAMKVAVGNEYHVSPDPDMHRVIKGHLYTDFSTDDETVVKKDGQEIFRYPGREMICGMAVKDGDIYTLGQSRSGEGFSYRKNGVSIIGRDAGRVFPRLQNDNDTLSFAFSEEVESAEGSIGRYYHVINGRVQQVAVRDDVRKVWDIMFHEGGTCYLADMTGISAPVIVSSKGMRAMELSSGMKPVTCRLIPAGRTTALESIYIGSGMSWSSGLWKDGRIYKLFPAGMTVGSLCTWDDGICCVLNSSLPSGGGTIFRCGETFPIPAGYISMGGETMSMVDGILHVGLSSLKGGRPVIWKDGNIHELKINGFICSLTVQ